MKNLLLSSILLLSFACNLTEKPKESPNQYAEFEQAFQLLDSILTADNGTFWNHQLLGPLLFVNPETRVFVANQNNDQNDFELIGKVYTDTLPEEINIANTAFDWNGQGWSMIMTPLPQSKKALANLMVHELFHQAQPALGFSDLPEKNNSHLDTYEGRLLFRLELEALLKAVEAKDTPQAKSHISNALAFRQIRHTSPEIKDAENSLEINEGMAEYTGLMLSGRNEEEMKEHLEKRVATLSNSSSFVRSFAYEAIPIYGYLLGQNWHKKIDSETQLTDLFVKKFAVSIQDTDYKSLALENNYRFEEIVQEEQEREQKRLARIEEYKNKFLHESALVLPLQNMNMSFDYRLLVPLGEDGTVYPQINLSDNWGTLTAEEGVLISANWSKIIVSKPTFISDTTASGQGWSLKLADKWKINQEGDKSYMIKE